MPCTLLMLRVRWLRVCLRLGKKLQPNELPGWPARMALPLAAAYVDESPTLFKSRAKKGRWPQGRQDGGKRVYWYRDELDVALARGRKPTGEMTAEDLDREMGIANGRSQASAQRS